jgi:Ca-activated chloride channel family protein
VHASQRFLLSIGFIAVAMISNLPPALAQSAIDEVHIQPRVHPSQPDSPNSVAKNAPATIRKNVELVLVPVTVTDESNRIVTGLDQQNFQLYEDKRPQPIKHFWSEDTPVSVGIVLDMSGSMKTKIERARDAVMALLKASNPQDEFFLTTFADKPTLLHDFTSNVEEIEDQLLTMAPKGRTSLLDAIVMSVNNMKSARYQRRALVIISDGGDNRSRYTEREVKSMIDEQDVLVYSMGVFDSDRETVEEQLGPELLEEISSVTGASSYTLDNPEDLPVAAKHIANELRNQYMLGYSPDTCRRDGKWRKIKVKLALPKGLPHLSVQARTGYYGPQ